MITLWTCRQASIEASPSTGRMWRSLMTAAKRRLPRTVNRVSRWPIRPTYEPVAERWGCGIVLPRPHRSGPSAGALGEADGHGLAGRRGGAVVGVDRGGLRG